MSMDIEDSRANLLAGFEHKRTVLAIASVVLGCATFALLVATIVLAVQKAQLQETIDNYTYPTSDVPTTITNTAETTTTPAETTTTTAKTTTTTAATTTTTAETTTESSTMTTAETTSNGVSADS